jgi:hypothetical protein
MKNANYKTLVFSSLTGLATFLLMGTGIIYAHCDTMDEYPA